MTQIAPLGRYRAFDADGNPLAGGKLYTYEAGTSTPKATFTTSAGDIANANPVILDADGYADVWLGVGGYKFSLFNASDVLQWTADNIDGGAAAGFASQVVSRSSSFSLGVNEQNVVNVCTAPLTVSLLPAGTAGNGFTSIILNLSGGNVTIDPDGSETINNTGTLTVGNGQSAIISTDGLEWYAFGYTQVEFSDSVFRITDNADATKKLAFEVSGVTTGTTRTITAASTGITLPANTLTVSADATGPSSIVLAEDTDNGSNTVQIIAPSAVTSNRVLTLPDETGTIVSTARLATTAQTGIVQLRAGEVIQSAMGTNTTAVQLNVTVPQDNTIPQLTEGAEIVTVSITPTSASSLLRVRAIASGTASVNSSTFIPMIFRDSTANALCAGYGLISGVNGTPFTMSIETQFTAGSTSATTIRFRIGRVGASSGWINGDNAGNPFWGGVGQAVIVVEEIQV
jgi:hypothetical protein